MKTEETMNELTTDETYFGSGRIRSVVSRKARNGRPYQRVELAGPGDHHFNSWDYCLEKLIGFTIVYSYIMRLGMYPTLEEILSLQFIDGPHLVPGPDGDWTTAVIAT